MSSRFHVGLLTLFNLAYVLIFTAYYIAIRNYEFLFYILILVILITGVTIAHRKLRLPLALLWALSVWGLMHMAGGGLVIEGTTLYDMELFPIWVTDNFYLITFDQFVHLYLYFVMVFLLYQLCLPCFSPGSRTLVLYSLITLASIGIGALNEVAEFTTVLVFQDTGVGGYYNNAWDIVFNTIGSIAGVITLHIIRMKPKDEINSP